MFTQFSDKTWPIRREFSIYAALFVVGLVPRLLLTYGSFPLIWADSLTYVKWATQIVETGDFSHHAIYRTPAYPLFLAFFMKVFGEVGRTGFVIIGVQRLLGILSGLLLYKIGLETIRDRVLCIVAATLFLVLPTQLYYETTILTETPFTFLLLLSFLVALPLVKNRDGRAVGTSRFVCLGALFAVLTLTRPIGEFLFPMVLMLILIVNRKRSLLPAAAACGVFLAILIPWAAVNHSTYDFWGVSRDQGLNLYHRVIDVDRAIPKSLDQTVDPEIRRIYDRSMEQSRISYFDVYNGLLRRRVSPLEADQRMGAFAKETLFNDPRHFIPHTLVTFRKFFVNTRNSVNFCEDGGGPEFVCSPLQGKTELQSFPDFPSHLSARARAASVWFLRYVSLPPWFVGVASVIGGVLMVARRSTRRTPDVYLILTVLYFSGLTALFNRAEDRFRVPVEGFLLLLAVHGLLFVITLATSFMARSKTRSSTPQSRPTAAA